ncbi:MAG: sulfite exporter TauE/SafE family protein [Ferruginibacter sp.]
MDHIFIFYTLLIIVAFLYASVGHGGASGYLALMALFSFAPAVMKPTALLLNLFVSAISFYQFYRGKHFLWKIFLPLAMASVPMAYLGGTIHLEAGVYKKILGLFLLIPVTRFVLFPNIAVTDQRPSSFAWSLLIGGAIGFFSGLIGIGGGIILSPILLLLKWTDQKQTAAISALFIFVNSSSGLAGQFKNGIEFTTNMYWCVGLAVIGGCCGAYLGALKFNQLILKNILAGVLLLAAVKLFFT